MVTVYKVFFVNHDAASKVLMGFHGNAADAIRHIRRYRKESTGLSFWFEEAPVLAYVRGLVVLHACPRAVERCLGADGPKKALHYAGWEENEFTGEPWLSWLFRALDVRFGLAETREQTDQDRVRYVHINKDNILRLLERLGQ